MPERKQNGRHMGRLLLTRCDKLPAPYPGRRDIRRPADPMIAYAIPPTERPEPLAQSQGAPMQSDRTERRLSSVDSSARPVGLEAYVVPPEAPVGETGLSELERKIGSGNRARRIGRLIIGVMLMVSAIASAVLANIGPAEMQNAIYGAAGFFALLSIAFFWVASQTVG